MHRRERRRHIAALGLSLVAHGLVVAWLLHRATAPTPATSQPSRVRLVWMDAAAPSASPLLSPPADEAATSPPTTAAAGGASADAARSAAAAANETDGASTTDASAKGGAGASARTTGVTPTSDVAGKAAPTSSATGKSGAAAPADEASKQGAATATGGSATRTALRDGAASLDGPRALELLPGADVLGPPGESGATPGGRTLYPSDLPGADELLAEETARVHDRVDGWIRGAVAAARVRGGLPDPAYGALGAALRDATREVPKFIDTNSPKEVGAAFVESWQAGAAKYGATGALYAEPEGRVEAIEKPSALAEAASRGSPDGIALSQFFAAGARLQEFADGRAGAELYALVEIRQQGSGAVDSVTLLRPSGVLPFDRWVRERATTVASGFAGDAGGRAKPYRSLWRFDGIVTFRRKLKLSELDARAAVGMMSMAALSLLSGVGHTTPPQPNSEPRDLGSRVPAFVGRFDELTGEVDMVDLTNPQYDCRVTLLEAD
ncbi:MAG: hypothetical protein AB1730_11000 [Myxococcota bacterium]